MAKRFAIHVLLILMLIGMGKVCQAQDPTFSQFNLNQVYYNAAYLGDHKGYQVAATYRTQWPNVPGKVFPGPLSTYYAMFDTYLESGKSYAAGAGVFAMQNFEGQGFLKTTTVGVGYAQHLHKIGGRRGTLPRMQLSLGFKAYLNSYSIDWDRLVFSDQLDINQGIIGQSAFPQSGMGSKLTVDADLGLLLKNNFKGKDKWYNEVGFAMAHILNPSISMTGASNSDSRLPRKYVASYRTTVNLSKNKVFTGGTILFEKQQDFYQLNTGIDIYYNPSGGATVIPFWISIMNRLSISPGLGNTNALIGSLRYKWLMGKKAKAAYYVGFSADLPYSGLALKTKGAYELSLGIIMPRKGQTSYSRCPHGTF